MKITYTIGRNKNWQFYCHGLEPWQVETSYAKIEENGKAWIKTYEADVPIGTIYSVLIKPPIYQYQHQPLMVICQLGDKSMGSIKSQAGTISVMGHELLAASNRHTVRRAIHLWKERPADRTLWPAHIESMAKILHEYSQSQS
jgi:hypothetical protein